jgi:phosphopantothenoylcysteine decarboxylase/phosphopantothenate--cysteine ligase
MTRILLGISASAAVAKAADLASKLRQANHEVDVVMTPNAAKLISPQLLEALTNRPVFVNEFGPERNRAMDHIDLARSTELLLIAPASADFIGVLSAGLAPNLLATLCLAIPSGVPRVLIPAMNPHMFAQPAVQRNLATLSGDGWRVEQPDSGEVACGDEGPGRFLETSEVLERLGDLLRD